MVDFPTNLALSWDPLAAIAGGRLDDHHDGSELSVLMFLIADRDNAGSVISAVEAARENLRTTREIMPREAWQTLNSLSQYVASDADRAVGRQYRDRFLQRVIDDSRRLDGVLESTMSRDPAYSVWRLGRLIERADMTTRVIGVRAAAIFQMREAHIEQRHDEVQWMGVLRSLSALQMYQRATRGPINGSAVVHFLLFSESFPRAVRACATEIRSILGSLPGDAATMEALDDFDRVLATSNPTSDDAEPLDLAMDALQESLGRVGEALADRYFAIER